MSYEITIKDANEHTITLSVEANSVSDATFVAAYLIDSIYNFGCEKAK